MPGVNLWKTASISFREGLDLRFTHCPQAHLPAPWHHSRKKAVRDKYILQSSVTGNLLKVFFRQLGWERNCDHARPHCGQIRNHKKWTVFGQNPDAITLFVPSPQKRPCQAVHLTPQLTVRDDLIPEPNGGGRIVSSGQQKLSYVHRLGVRRLADAGHNG